MSKIDDETRAFRAKYGAGRRRASGPSEKAIWAWFSRLVEKTRGYHRPTSLSPADAKKLKRAIESADSHREHDAVLDLADKMVDGHGVEAIRADAQIDRYYYDVAALYVNMGDTYDATLLFDTEKETYQLTSWGDWVERQKRSRRYRFP